MNMKELLVWLTTMALLGGAASSLQAQAGEAVVDLMHQGEFARQEEIMRRSGAAGEEEITIRDAVHHMDEDTDLLLSFDDGRADVQGAYQLISFQGYLQKDLHALGNGAVVFLDSSAGMVLEPRQGSMFQPGTYLGAFSIEFWFYSGAPREGGEVLAWQGSSWIGTEPLFQKILVSLQDRRLTWNLENFFVRGEIGDQTDGFTGLPVVLRQRRELIPRTWSHHLLRYNPDRSVLEYLVNGVPESVVHVTDTGDQTGTPFNPYVGELSEPAVRIGQYLNGAVDEFRISRTWREPDQSRTGDLERGRLIYRPLDLYYPGARVQGAQVEGRTPGATEIRTYFFLSDYLEDPGFSDPRWQLLDVQGGLKEVSEDPRPAYRGRFLYTMVELLPDGVRENKPGLRSLSVEYRTDPVPPAPQGVRVSNTEDGVLLEWNPVLRGNPEGYMVFFGTGPDTYFDQNPRRVEQGNQALIQGLQPGRVYYFRVGSYNYSNNPQRGAHIPLELSSEVHIRAEG